MNKIKSYLADIFNPVVESPLTALLPRGDLKAFLTTYMNTYLKTWVLLGFIGGLIGFGLAWALTNTYFSKAAQQAISPELWNIVVTFGFLCTLLGALAKLTRLNKLARHSLNAAKVLLVFASEVGAIGYGVLLAMLVFAVAQSDFNSFWSYIYTSVGVWLMILIAFFNLVVFWVLYCLNPSRRLPVLLQNLRARPIFSWCLCICLFSMFLTATVITKPSSTNQTTQQTCLQA